MSSLRSIEELLWKSLLGQELVNTQFHLFSRRSRSTGKVVECRVLCANNVLLTENAKFFADLLNSGANPSESDVSLSNLAENDGILNGVSIGEYGYESDSDLEDVDDDNHDDDDDDAESCSGHDDAPLLVDKEEADASTEATGTTRDAAGTSPAVSTTQSSLARLKLIDSRHIVVKDTAFQTWYALLNYLYTGKLVFLPLKSSSSHSGPSSTGSPKEPKCSAKSMYRLACKVGIDALRDVAFGSICNSLTEHNILTELTSTITSRYPPILEMELDILFKHIASPPIVTSLPLLVRRIANKEIPHGGDIINGLYTRILTAHYLPAPVAMGPLSPPFKPFSEKDPSNCSLTLYYHTITAMQHYRGMSTEELRLQDYKQHCKTALNPPSFGTSGTSSTEPFWRITQQSATTSSIFGCGAFRNHSASTLADLTSSGGWKSSESLDVPAASAPVARGPDAGVGNGMATSMKKKKKK